MCIFSVVNGIEVIERCKQLNREIYFIEAFIVTESTIQPSMDHSVDFPRKDNRIGEICDGNWEAAKDFLAKLVDTNFVFEVFFEGC